MAWYDFILGTDVQKNIDHVASGVDAMFFTDEEKSVAHNKVIDYNLKALSTQSIARRVIAIAVVGEYFLLLNIAVGLQLYGTVESLANATFVFEIIKDAVKEPTNWVLGFYFLTGMVGKLKK